MTLLRAALAALALALAVPAIAFGSDRFVVRDVPVSPAGVVQARQVQEEFNLVGLHWKGPGTVSFRTASPDGAWSGWHEAAPEAEDKPTGLR